MLWIYYVVPFMHGGDTINSMHSSDTLEWWQKNDSCRAIDILDGYCLPCYDSVQLPPCECRTMDYELTYMLWRVAVIGMTEKRPVLVCWKDGVLGKGTWRSASVSLLLSRISSKRLCREKRQEAWEWRGGKWYSKAATHSLLRHIAKRENCSRCVPTYRFWGCESSTLLSTHLKPRGRGWGYTGGTWICQCRICENWL